MLRTNLKPHHGTVVNTKAKRIGALAFFSLLTATLSVTAQTNWVDGTAYGTNDLSTAASIASVENGPGSLAIGFSGTTNLTLGHNIEGFIMVSNRIDGFSIEAGSGSVTGSQSAVLIVMGGTNLAINGGAFVGTTGEGGIDLPPLPGQSGQTNTESSAAMGGIMYQVADVQISGTTFSGTTFNPDSSTSTGTDGLMLLESGWVVISNGILTGGNGGDVDGGTSTGGDALHVEYSFVEIAGGTYAGGSAGAAAASTGGSALYAIDSTIEIGGDADFTGGTNAAALHAKNSDLTINSGTFQGGSYGTNDYFGLVSYVDSAQSNNIALNGGTFNSIDFAGSGIQFLTTGTNLQVNGYVVLDDGTLIVDNATSTPFQNLWIRDGDFQFLNDYTLLSEGILAFQVVTNSHGTLSAETVTFESNSTVHVDASLASFDVGTNTITLVSANSGIYVSTNAATSTNLEENVTLTATTAGRISFTGVQVVSNSIVFQFNTRSLSDYLGATGTFGEFIDELETLLPDGMDTTINQINDPSTAGALLEETYFTTFNNFQTALQGMRAAVGQSLSRGSEFRDQLKLLPPGAKGPERKNKLRGWAKYYGHYFSHDEQQLNPGYDTVLQGGVAGIDTSIGNLLVGICGGSSFYNISYGGNAESDTEAYHGSLYGTYGMDRGYIDAGIAYGLSQVDTRTAEPFRLDGSFDAEMAGVWLGGGYDLIDIGGETVFTPEASIQYTTYEQDAYVEKSTTAVPRAIDGFDADSLLSSIGMNVSMLNSKKQDTFGYKADLRVHWLHEFNPDPSDMTFMLQGGSDSYPLTYPALDEDLFRIGFGCAFFNKLRYQPRNVMLRIDFDELFGDGFNSHNLSAKVVYAF